MLTELQKERIVDEAVNAAHIAAIRAVKRACIDAEKKPTRDDYFSYNIARFDYPWSEEEKRVLGLELGHLIEALAHAHRRMKQEIRDMAATLIREGRL